MTKKTEPQNTLSLQTGLGLHIFTIKDPDAKYFFKYCHLNNRPIYECIAEGIATVQKNQKDTVVIILAKNKTQAERFLGRSYLYYYG